MTKKQRRIFTPEFKEQMVKLYENDKSKRDIIAEYELTTTSFNTWIKEGQATGSFSEKDNSSPEENELIEGVIVKRKLRKVQNYEASIRNGKPTRAKSLS